LAFSSVPLPATPTAGLAAQPAFQEARWRVYHVSFEQPNEGVGPCLYTGSLKCPCAPIQKQGNRLRTFWFKPHQHLWLSSYNGAYGSSLALDLSFSLTLQPP